MTTSPGFRDDSSVDDPLGTITTRPRPSAVWRYAAIPLGTHESPKIPVRRGELAGDSAANVRASLRLAGLQVIEIKPASRARNLSRSPGLQAWRAHLRSRRRGAKADLFDSLATMLEAGLPMLESLATLASSTGARRSALRTMLVQLHEALASGSSLAGAMRTWTTWFDPVEIAMIEAGQLSGEMAPALRSLTERHRQSGELTGRLAASLTYPAVITLVGLGVVAFLSTRTLPSLVKILIGARVPVPRLTVAVMAFGQGLVRWWPVLLLALIAAIVGAGCAMRVSQHSQLQLPLRVRRCLPQAFRRALLARLTFALADLLKTGVPLVEAVRAAAPTVGGTVGIGLRRRLLAGADRIERGEPLSAVLDDPLWFDAELRQLLAIGEKSGEIDDMLRRIGARAERQTRRLIDRLSAVLEPAVILGLAVLVGLVVMAGVLPLIRMQEVLR